MLEAPKIQIKKIVYNDATILSQLNCLPLQDVSSIIKEQKRYDGYLED